MQPDYEITRLIESQQDGIWLNQDSYELFFREVGAPNPPQEHFNFIKSKNGEMIVAKRENEILGWIGLIPDNNSCELAGIEVNRNVRNMGIGKALLAVAKQYIAEKELSHLFFGTSPLFTSNSLLYLHNNNAEYSYNNQVYIDKDNDIPWPYVECKIDLKSIREEYRLPDTEIRSLIDWRNNKPIIDEEMMSRDCEYKFLKLNYMDAASTMSLIRNQEYSVLRMFNSVFQGLTLSKYRFFDFIKHKNEYVYIFKKII